ncbi:hypothetical protein MNBD_GAMMA25-2647 [hydrothermal vent metagenome]|uniref:Uncharacterized protein n=1 Tax=hydrothermal vent metagenome TaxID=652676 RepID=A0A3B1AN40_9ZZZZ
MVSKVIRRNKLFLILSAASVIVALSLTVLYSWQAYTRPDFDIGIHFIVVILILLNARQNLRQYKYAKIFLCVFKNNSMTLDNV